MCYGDKSAQPHCLHANVNLEALSILPNNFTIYIKVWQEKMDDGFFFFQAAREGRKFISPVFVLSLRMKRRCVVRKCGKL